MNSFIRLGHEECYDAAKLPVWSFKTVNDIVHGVHLRLGNMCGGFPFEFHGRTWPDSERLYLCGQFSDIPDEKHIEAQRELCAARSGYAAKRFVRNKYRHLMRTDFGDLRLHWMLFAVWTKCCGNHDFAQLLTSIPSEAILIEDTTAARNSTSAIWGCSNPELLSVRKAQEKSTPLPVLRKGEQMRLMNIRWNSLTDVGCWRGQNNMGKILMICRDCLQEGMEPPIDYTLLSSYHIHLFGYEIDFIDKPLAVNRQNL